MAGNKPFRVKRGRSPKGKISATNYRKVAYTALDRDFEGRCAYSMLHKFFADGSHHVDHFNPTIKKNYPQPYSNLFPATSACNLAKSDTWPSARERRKGHRFLNPCKEMDYSEHMLEHPYTHELIGVTPSGRYQIIHCDLNRENLIYWRRYRAEFSKRESRSAVMIHGEFTETHRLLQGLEEEQKLHIPPIKFAKVDKKGNVLPGQIKK